MPRKKVFKEWTKVVQALGEGRQQIILRKGGIIEENGSFSVQEDDFLLLPTLYHQQNEKIKQSWLNEVGEEDIYYQNHQQVWIRFEAFVKEVRQINSWKELAKLDDQHVWREDVIQERYERWQEHQVTLLVVDVKKLEPPILLDLLPEHGGCKSWIEIDF
ncbi:MAG: DUF1802 family protein [Cytophagales bacterium]|nr:DUF1802 family protein [Cytophagales bacterium]